MSGTAGLTARRWFRATASFLMCILAVAAPPDAGADHDRAGAARPVYIFVHRANDVPPNNDNDIQEAIDGGGNAIEFDLYACNVSSGWKVHHDGCSGAGSRTLAQWLSAYRHARGRDSLRAIAFDLKAPAPVSAQRMHQLVDQARAAIASDVLIIYGVGSWANRRNLEPIMQGLRQNELVTIDYSERSAGFAEKVIRYFESHSVINQAFADGIAAALPTGDTIPRNLAEAVVARDGPGRTRLVYSWTYESESPIRRMLIDRRLDGVLVNDCKVFCISHLSLDDGLDNALDVVANHRGSIRIAGPGDETHFGTYALQPALLNAVLN